MHCQAEEEEIRKAAAKGIIINHTDSLFIPLNNRLPDDDDEDDGEGGGAFVAGTGLDSALDVLSLAVKGPGKTDEHPERRQKVRKKSIHSCLQTAVDNHPPPLRLDDEDDYCLLLFSTYMLLLLFNTYMLLPTLIHDY